MARMKRWGITLPLPGLPLSEQRELVSALPGLGYTDAWSMELAGMDAFSPLVLASQWAPELRLGTAIAGIYTRAPVALALHAGTLGLLAPGRFVMGIGTSSQVAVEEWNGIPFERPLQRSRDMLRFLRTALTGSKVTQQYETFAVNGFRLDPAPPVPPALALAALRPGMIRVAVAEADAVITNWLAPTDVPQVRSVAGEDVEVIARVFICPTTDTEMARAIGRRVVAAYLTVPVYAAFHEWLGRGELLAPMLKAWAAGDRRGALEVLPDEVVDELVIHGPLEYTPIMQLLPVPGADLATSLRKLGPS
jgi:probable F420-dependent oxidoreductase